MKIQAISSSPQFSRLGRIILVFCFSMLLKTPGYSQQADNVTVTGRVIFGGAAMDLAGTSVQVKGKGKGVSTDASGHYTIIVPSGSTLIFSHIGFKTYETRLDLKGKTQAEINISLEPSDNSLDQVVVVSYGKQQKRDITGAVVKVSASDAQDVPAAEFGQKLQGKVAGLQVNQTSGLPGQGMTFRIRGAASLGSGNQPLIVIDGQPIISDVGSGDANLISPDEIESYSVLKDAAATALYGSRASNGVILITTKQAKMGRTAVSANAYYGLQSVPKRGRPDMMNAHEFATFMKGYFEDKILYKDWSKPSDAITAVPVDYANPDQYGAGTDWYSTIFKTAPIQDYMVNISSGNEKMSTSTTFSYFDQQGVLYNTGVKRFAVRSNNEYRPISWIKIGLNLAPTYQLDHNTRNQGGNLSINGFRQVVSGAISSSPLQPVYKPDGTFNSTIVSKGMIPMPNFLQQQQIMRNNQSNMHLLGNAYVDFELIKGLHLRSSINGDLGSQDYNAYFGSMYGYNNNPPPRSLASATAYNNSNNSYSWLNENLLTYSTRFGDHNFDVLAGYTTQKFSMNSRNINGTGFASDAVPWISGATTTTGTSTTTTWTVASALARLNYDYKKRYYLSATIRNDASSRFGAYKKYATFPSISAGWVVSDEAFFPKTNTISFLKFKGSYGLTGNNNLGNNNTQNYPSITLLSPANYVFNGATTTGQAISSLGNPNLTWETSKQTDIGIEMNFLKNRISFTYDYYNKRTEDMLATLALPYASGYSSMSYNVGVFRIWGHELQLSTKNMVGEFNWSTDFNISFNDNKVVSLVNNTPIGGNNKYYDYNRTAVGHRIGEFFGYVFQGVYMTQADFDKSPHEATSELGSAKMKDISSSSGGGPDGKIDSYDKTFIGNPNPNYIFGISNNFGYKNFDLNIIAAGQVGNQIMNVNLQNIQNLDGAFNLEKDMMDRWRSEANPGNGKVPRTKSTSTELYRLVNTNWVFSGDYLTIKNIALGYTFRQQALKYIKSVRIYASVQNAFVFTKYPGQNPEVNDNKDSQTTAGLDNGSFPNPRTVMFGANFNF